MGGKGKRLVEGSKIVFIIPVRQMFKKSLILYNKKRLHNRRFCQEYNIVFHQPSSDGFGFGAGFLAVVVVLAGVAAAEAVVNPPPEGLDDATETPFSTLEYTRLTIFHSPFIFKRFKKSTNLNVGNSSSVTAVAAVPA